MTLTDNEFAAMLSDETKIVSGDILWTQDEDHSPSFEFTVDVQSDAGWPLFVRGSFNPLLPALSFVMILKTAGRVYALDLGKDHKNPDGNMIGEKHKHRWTEQHRDKQAHVPQDITAAADDPLTAWTQFCLEANLRHVGTMHQLPPVQGDLF